jgi:hypothetical protein
MNDQPTNEPWIRALRSWDIQTTDLTQRVSAELDSANIQSLSDEVHALRQAVEGLRSDQALLLMHIRELRVAQSNPGRSPIGALLSPFTQPDTHVGLS